MRKNVAVILLCFITCFRAYSQPSWPADTCPCTREHEQSVVNNPLFAGNKIVKVNHSGGAGYISFSSFLDELGTKDSTTYIIDKSTQVYVVGCRTIYIGGWSATDIRRCIEVRGSTGKREDVVIAGADPAIDPNFWKSAEYGGSSGCNAGKAFQIVSAEHIIFADLTLRNFAGKTIAIDGGLDKGKQYCGKDVRLHNLDIWDCGSQLIKVGGAPVSSRNCILECSKIHYTDGLFTESNYQTQGIDVHRGRNWIVRDNFFLNMRMHAGTGSWGTGILFWDNSDSALIERNLVMNCDFAMAIGLGDNDTTDHMTVINNLIINNDNSGNWKPDDVIATKTNFTIHGGVFHNTIYNPYTGGAAFAVCNSALPVKNNLYITGTTNRCASQSNNLVAADSWFVNPAAFDFHLKTNHTVPAVSGVSQDAEEQLRANPPTAGAFEYIISKTYYLSVSNGSGSGNYVSGATVSIAANAPVAGMVFDKWTGDVTGIINVNSSTTTIKMPSSNANITATYKTGSALSDPNDPEFSLYPNPAKDVININRPGMVSIYNLNGILMFSKQISNDNNQLNVSNLASGIYFIKIIHGNNINIARFLKE